MSNQLVHLTRKSSNVKTGKIPVSTTCASSCPPSCPLAKHGCYADGGPIAIHWKMVTDGRRGTDWESFCESVTKLPHGSLWRHNQAGDLPGTQGIIDHEKVQMLTQANSGRRGFTYSHYLPTDHNVKVIQQANNDGFCINWSADNPNHADELVNLGVAPVVSLIPLESPERMFTPGSQKIIQCPAQTRENVACISCGLCARIQRDFIIGFTPHGAGTKAANEIAKATD